MPCGMLCALRGGLRLSAASLQTMPQHLRSAAVIVCAIGQIPSLQPTLFLQPPAQTCHRQLCRRDGRTLLPVHFLFCERETEKGNRGERDMAIYHLEAKVVSRGAGRSAVAASAYLSCSRLYNDYDGIQHDYTKKQGLVWQEVFPAGICPAGMARSEKSSGTPWRKSRRPRTADLAREFVVALAHRAEAVNSKLSCCKTLSGSSLWPMECAPTLPFMTPMATTLMRTFCLTVRPLDEQGHVAVQNREGISLHEKR